MVERPKATRIRRCFFCGADVDFLIGDGMYRRCEHCGVAAQFSTLGGVVMAHATILLPGELRQLGKDE